MGKSKQQFMDLNRETAMRLWNKSFGKVTKATDFAGRVIAKGAYNDRNSEFGWNVDHVLPQSKGGVTADYNLVCCHIKTNDEKANKFPGFTANGITFEIIKVQNHYEIRAKDKVQTAKPENDTDDVDFYDSASGVRFFKKIKGIQNKKRFVGTVFIKLRGVSNNAVVDFIEELMEEEDISYKRERNYYGNDLVIVARNTDMPLKDDISELLDKCILLNTYLSKYFVPMEYIKAFDIYYRVDCFEDKTDMYASLGNINFNNMNYNSNTYLVMGSQSGFHNSIFLNGMVLENTEAGEKVSLQAYTEYVEYNYIFTKLSENLKKEVDGN